MQEINVKYNSKMSVEELKRVPQSILKKVYDEDDNVLFGSRYVKGKVAYEYIPAEYMEDNIPFYICASISYDGEGNSTLPKDAVIMKFEEVVKMFPNNKSK